jgi:uncharacterized protein
MNWLLLLAILVFGVPALAWLFQDRLIFFPQPLGSIRHLPTRAVPFEVLAADGTHLRGWIVPGAAAPAPAVIYFGGNAEEVSWTLADARWPREWAIVGLNYRGYGASDGKPGQAAIEADALAIYDAIAGRGDVDPRRIVVFGRSLGTAVAAHVAARRAVAGAVLASPYDSMTALGRLHYPWLPVSLLLRHPFDAAADAKNARMPMLAIVAEADTIVPPERSRALFEAWAGQKTWLSIRGADHNSLGATADFWQGVGGFLYFLAP